MRLCWNKADCDLGYDYTTIRGKLYDNDGNELPNSVVLCDTETGEVTWAVVDKYGCLNVDPKDKTRLKTKTARFPAPLTIMEQNK